VHTLSTKIGPAFLNRLYAGASMRGHPGADFRSGNIPRPLIGTRYSSRYRTVAFAVLGFGASTLTSPSHAQAPDLLTAATYAVLAGSTVTNTGPSVLNGNLGVSPGSAITGFPPGLVLAPGSTNAANAAAVQAQIDLTTAYNAVAAQPTTQNLTGQNLGGLTLTPGVYAFNSSAQLTGNLVLNALGNPNAEFVFKIGSTLTTASSSTVTVIGGGVGTNVFWQVGSSATLGTTTSFVGDILALTSITLDTGTNIACGSALAHNGAVTLDTNHISIGNLAPCTPAPLLPVPPVVIPPGTVPVVVPPGVTVPPGTTPVVVPPGLVPPGAVVVIVPAGVIPPGTTPLGVLPVTVPGAVVPVVTAIDTAFLASGSALPPAILGLSTIAPATLVNSVLPQLSGQVATGVAPAVVQAMSSFMSLMTNPFASFAPGNPLQPASPLVYKAAIANGLAAGPAPASDRWGVWAAGYGGGYNIAGSPSAGTPSDSGSGGGAVMGIDYRVTPYTTAGFAVGVGEMNYGLSGNLGNGRDNLFQSAVYSMTRVDAAYVAGVLAFAWDHASTDRTVSVSGIDTLNADFSAYDFAGRIEGGYRFAIPDFYGLPSFGITPYGAFQMQGFLMPSYGETAAVGSLPTFALSYDAQRTTVYQTELGAWFDKTIALGNDASLSLWNRTAWAHDQWSGSNLTATFQSFPSSAFAVIGATPAGDSLIASAGAAVFFKNGLSLAANFTAELGERWQNYSGTAWLRYAF